MTTISSTEEQDYIEFDGGCVVRYPAGTFDATEADAEDTERVS